jgi:N-methylhydantoinase A
MGEWHVGIDIGGTFTDIVAIHPDDRALRSAKVPSRAKDPVASILAAITAISLQPRDIAELVHGTTRVTNAIVEGKLEPVVLIGTEGFEDIIEIGRQSRRDLYRLEVRPKPEPLVPRERRIPLAERMLHDGTVQKPLSAAAIEAATARALASGASSVAIVLLHSYANPSHELALGQALRGKVAFLSLSHAVNPEAREYERMIATVLNAAVMPLAAAYLTELRATLPSGLKLGVMHSAGGMATPEAAAERPLLMALSGPAAGVAAAAAIARELNEKSVLSFDMGGTTTDVALILEGQAEITADAKLADQPLRQPMVAIESIGAGGGSIVRHGVSGLSIGPQSAGAEPGPASYGRGGELPTVCDANVILGYLNPKRRLGTEIELQPERARAVFAPLAAALNLSVEALALGVLRVADATMARALNKITVERGVDGRGATLLAFGGMGPMHAIGLARSYGISRVIVPAASSAFSALGCVTAEHSATRQRTLRMASDGFDGAGFATARAALVDELRSLLDNNDNVETEETAMIRYRGQSYAVDVALTGPVDGTSLGRIFAERHQALFGFVSGQAWEVMGLRTRLRVPRPPSLATVISSGAAPKPFQLDACWFDAAGAVPTARYERAALVAPHIISGPAIIEDDWSTTVIPPGWEARATGNGHILLQEQTA